jgi:hypothetical protein
MFFKGFPKIFPRFFHCYLRFFQDFSFFNIFPRLSQDYPSIVLTKVFQDFTNVPRLFQYFFEAFPTFYHDVPRLFQEFPKKIPKISKVL